MELNKNAFKILEDRGFIFQTTDMEELKKKLQNERVTFYIGIDPTADDLHIGHFFGLRMARILQNCGHKCIILIGNATALIGDPTNKTDMRKMLSKEEVERNAREISSIVHRFIKTDGDNPATIVQNGDWIKPISYVDFLRDVGVHFNVSEMLAKDLYKNRLQKGGLTFMEMGYMLMQAFDFVHLNNEFNCTLQIGGSDQWGNICAGVDLFRKLNTSDSDEKSKVIGLTCPLLTNANGIKMGKTEKGTLWVSREKTSAFEFFQHFINCLDADVERLLRFFTDIDVDEIKSMCQQDIISAKERMAFEVTKLVHGEEEAIKAKEISESLFKNGTENENMATEEIAINGDVKVQDLLIKTSLFTSKSDIRRLMDQNGIMINKEKCKFDESIHVDKGDELIIRKGKKTFLKVRIV